MVCGACVRSKSKAGWLLLLLLLLFLLLLLLLVNSVNDVVLTSQHLRILLLNYYLLLFLLLSLFTRVCEFQRCSALVVVFIVRLHQRTGSYMFALLHVCFYMYACACVCVCGGFVWLFVHGVACGISWIVQT